MNTVDILVGKRIRACRRSLGISQTELGDAIGVRFQQVQKYETGANRVSASRLWSIADVLGVDVTQFFDGIKPDKLGGSGKDATPQDNMSFLSDPEKLELIELYAALPEGQKKAVLAFIRSMANTETKVKVTT
ncbi:helix-turn-helix domain-containing protein [Sedimentitalea sp. HM32M-2]|uniref:helix-turn-helix domain-containing protein n=1 Tax=Sedimentitalea sp. HM32M-2 TaxID=3351566 RepID=UPI0036453346